MGGSGTTPEGSKLDALIRGTDTEPIGDEGTSVRRWAEADPKSASEWAEHLSQGPIRREAMLQVAIAWGSSDPSNGARWVTSIPSDSNKAPVTIAFSYEAARENPTIALQVVGELEPSAERDQALEYAVSQWAGMDASVAAAWALQVPEPALSQRLVAAAAIVAAERDPLAAAMLVVTNLGPGDEQNRAAVSVVQRWAQTSPQAAADWVAKFPDTPTGVAAAENLFSIWGFRDGAAAADCLNRLPEGPLRQAALAGYSQALSLAPKSTPSS